MAIIIKTPEQIDGIRKSGKLAAATLNYIEQYIKPGVTTNHINNLAEKFIRDHGATPAPLGYLGFPKATCTSLNEVICHGIPSDSVFLKEGDILNVDVTTILNGYYGDTCRMFAVGEISQEAKNLIKVTKECLDLAIASCRSGQPFFMIGKTIQDHADSYGYGVVHQFCGHGTGLKFHEDPQVFHDFSDYNMKDIRPMTPGMIFTIEPMICTKSGNAKILNDRWTAVTADGGLSAQFEHTILITENGVEILTGD